MERSIKNPWGRERIKIRGEVEGVFSIEGPIHFLMSITMKPKDKVKIVELKI